MNNGHNGVGLSFSAYSETPFDPGQRLGNNGPIEAVIEPVQDKEFFLREPLLRLSHNI